MPVTKIKKILKASLTDKLIIFMFSPPLRQSISCSRFYMFLCLYVLQSTCILLPWGRNTYITDCHGRLVYVTLRAYCERDPWTIRIYRCICHCIELGSGLCLANTEWNPTGNYNSTLPLDPLVKLLDFDSGKASSDLSPYCTKHWHGY